MNHYFAGDVKHILFWFIRWAYWLDNQLKDPIKQKTWGLLVSQMIERSCETKDKEHQL